MKRKNIENCRIVFHRGMGMGPVEGAICPQCLTKHWPKKGVLACLRRHAKADREAREKKFTCYRCGLPKPESAFKKHKASGWATKIQKGSPKVCNPCYINWGTLGPTAKKVKAKSNGY